MGTCLHIPPSTNVYTYPPIQMSAPLFYTDEIPLSPHHVLFLIFFIFGALGFFLTYFFLSSLISSILISLFIMKPKEQSSLVVLCYFSIHLKGMKLFLFLVLCSCLYVTEEQLGASACLCTSGCGLTPSRLPSFFPQGCRQGRGRREKEWCGPLFMENGTSASQ